MIKETNEARTEYINTVLELLGSVREMLTLLTGAEMLVPWQDVAKYLKVSPATISRARNSREVAYVLAESLQKERLIGKIPPVDPRNRVWMATNDIEKAVATLRREYPEYLVSVRKIENGKLREI